MDNNMDKLLSIPCDYDGYDFVFREGHTQPDLYRKITQIISNGTCDISEIDSYHRLCKEPDQDRFYDFYEEWIEFLQTEGVVTHLEIGTPMEEFARGLARILLHYHVELDEDLAAAEYMKTLKALGIDQVIYYDVLEANVAAGLIRDLGFELIALFDGSDNADFCVIPVSKLSEMKKTESEI